MDLLDLRDPASACTHGIGLLLALPATWSLWRRARGDRPRQASLAVFGFGLTACYLGSTLNHAVRGSEDLARRLGLLDHIGILVLIAATYTPLACHLLRGRWRSGTLAAAWGAAGLGAVLHLSVERLPGWAPTALYLAMGWGSLLCYVEIARVVPPRSMRWIPAGGLLYSVGALLNLVGRPVVWPGVFGAHEVFHLFVLAGSFAHYQFMRTVVAPAPPAPAIPRPKHDATGRLPWTWPLTTPHAAAPIAPAGEVSA